MCALLLWLRRAQPCSWSWAEDPALPGPCGTTHHRHFSWELTGEAAVPAPPKAVMSCRDGSSTAAPPVPTAHPTAVGVQTVERCQPGQGLPLLGGQVPTSFWRKAVSNQWIFSFSPRICRSGGLAWYGSD